MRPVDTGAADAGRQRLGLVLCLFAATGLGLAVAVSRMAYEGGTNGLTVASTRGCLLFLGIAVFCALSRRGYRLPQRDLWNCIGLGLLAAMMFYGNIAAVQYISVGLTALLFFTFPPIIAVLSIIFVRERVSIGRLAAIAIAFAGLALMLGVSADAIDPRGVALALGAALAAAWNSVWLSRRMGHCDIFIVTFHMAWVAAAALVALSLVLGGIHWPELAIGWVGLIGVVVLQATSVPAYFVAIPIVGAVKSGMISNLQPLISILAAYLLYDEVLSAMQWMGGAMVLGGVWMMQMSDRRRRVSRHGSQ